MARLQRCWDTDRVRTGSASEKSERCCWWRDVSVLLCTMNAMHVCIHANFRGDLPLVFNPLLISLDAFCTCACVTKHC